MKISFVFPQWTYRFKEFKKLAEGVAFSPLTLAYLAAIAQKEHEVQIIDGEAEHLTPTELTERVLSFNPDLIGMTATTSFFDTVTQQAVIFKRVLNSKIVIGGPHVTYFKEKVFKECFDYFIIGQCDGTFASFLRNPKETKGVLYRKNKKIIYTGNNDEVVDLNTLPWPLRGSLRHDLYIIGTQYGRKKYTTMMMSRGCPFKCVFCSTSIYGNKVRRRSVESVIEEIKEILNNYYIKHIYFTDDTLTLDRKFIMQVCLEIINRGLRFTWESSTRADLVDEELIKTMREAGCIRLSFGLESTDKQVRLLIRKHVPLEAYTVANRLTNKYGIETINSVMLGLPGDNRSTIEHTINYVRNCREIKHATFGIAIPYPGSEMYNMAVKELHGLKLVSEDFSMYQRYGSAVMTVGGISQLELLEYQRRGLMRIYLVWWRIIPVI